MDIAIAFNTSYVAGALREIISKGDTPSGAESTVVQECIKGWYITELADMLKKTLEPLDNEQAYAVYENWIFRVRQ